MVFLYQTVWQYSDSDPATGAKLAIFDKYLHGFVIDEG